MNPLTYQLSLVLFLQKKSFGPGPMMLLQGVEETGSLQKSAASMGMAYSKAWKLIRELEELWGFPLLYRHSGGAKGGGSILTQKAKMLLETYQNMLQDVENYTSKCFETYFDEKFWNEIRE